MTRPLSRSTLPDLRRTKSEWSQHEIRLGAWLAIVVALACVTRGSVSSEDQGPLALLNSVYDSELFELTPPGVGDLVSESSRRECAPESDAPLARPAGTRTWHLASDGREAVELYRSVGLASGWTVQAQRPPNPTAALFASEDSVALHLEHDVGEGRRLTFIVRVGSGSDGRAVIVVLAGLYGGVLCSP